MPENEPMIDIMLPDGADPLLDELNDLYAKASIKNQKAMQKVVDQYPKTDDQHFIPQLIIERFIRVLRRYQEEEKLTTIEDLPYRVTQFRNLSHLGIQFHGTRAEEHILRHGICIPPAAEYIHPPDQMPDPEDVPEHLREELDLESAEIFSPELADWMNEQGYSTEYDWQFLWRRYAWDWYKDLTPKQKKIFKIEARLPAYFKGKNYYSDVDILGEHISLFWVTESLTTAQEYSTKGVYEVDCTQANAWGYFVDEIVSGQGNVLVLPVDCIQIPGSALRRIQ